MFCSSANCKNVSAISPNKAFLWSAACRWWDLLITVGCCGGEKASIVPPDKGAQTGEKVHKGSHEFLGCIYIRLFITPHPVRAALMYTVHIFCEIVLPLLALTELKRLLKEEGAA